MAVRLHPLINKLNGGELDPRLEGLVDIPAYQDSAKWVKNLICRSKGGVQGRGGFRFAAATKYHDKKSRLIGFHYSALQNYVLELGHEYIRFYMNGGQIMVVSGADLITNGDFAADISDWDDLSTGAGSIAWNAGGYMEVTSAGGGVGWAEQGITTVVGSIYLLQFDVITAAVTVQVGSATGLHDVVAATSVAVQTGYQLLFKARTTTTYIQFKRSATGTSGVDNVVGKLEVPYEIASPYGETDLPDIQVEEDAEETYLVHPDYHPRLLNRSSHTSWTLAVPEFIDGPYEDELSFPTITPSATSGDGITLAGDNQTALVFTGAGLDDMSKSGTFSGTEMRNFRAEVDGAGATDTFKWSKDKGVTWDATGVAMTGAPQALTEGVSVTFAVTTGHTEGDRWDWEAHTLFRDEHVGSLWRIKHGDSWGYVRITAVTDAVTATADVKSTLGGVTASDGIREGAWSELNGYPRSIVASEGRMVFGGSPEHPDTFWGSKVGKALVMTPGSLADDPYVFKMSGSNKLIRWMAEGRDLMIGTVKGEVVAKGGTDTPISATTPPKMSLETTHGSAGLQALRIEKAAIFLQKSLRRIREFVYSLENDSFVSPDLTERAEHLMSADIVAWTYTQEPIPVIWAVRSDGILLGSTYNRYANTVGWHQHDTEGLFEDVCSIPYGGQDQLWAIVNRTIGGATKRYVEYRDPDIHVDSAICYSGGATGTLWGLQHLIGKTVQIVGDRMPRPSQVVPASGELTIEPAASSVYLGLGYTATLLTNRPEVQIAGTSQGVKKRWNEVIARVVDTVGLWINDEEIAFPQGNMDEGTPPYSGDVAIPNLGWDADGRILIQQKQPLPVHITAIMGTLVIAD